MFYCNDRRKIKNGDLLSWRGTSIWAKLISWWTGSPYTHVALAFWVGPRLMILESFPLKGVRMRPLSHCLPAFWQSAGRGWTQEAEDFALELLDRPYSIPDCIRVAFRMKPNGKGYQCAEYAALVLDRLSMQGLLSDPTPANVVQTLRRYGGDPELLEA